MNFTLITGASSGIGEAFARRLAAEKHNLILVARSEDELSTLCDELAAEHQIECHFVSLDLTDRSAPDRLFDETQRKGWEVDWLIKNAGVDLAGAFARSDAAREV